MFCKCLLLLVSLGMLQARAQTLPYEAGSMQVSQVRSPATPPGTRVGAVYLSITNRGAKPDSLLALTSPIAARVEIHRTTMVQGVMQMRPVAALECPAGGTVNIEPGALHIMLLGLTQPLAAGSTFPLSLKFRDAGILVVQVSVKALE
jgi:copper(I)-binding protein